MIGINTNILVRIVNDDGSEQSKMRMDDFVLAETVWVLQACIWQDGMLLLYQGTDNRIRGVTVRHQVSYASIEGRQTPISAQCER